MPTEMTFTSLVEDLTQYAERGNATTDTQVQEQIPKIINLRERQIARELKVQGFINVVTFSLTPSLPVYPKPDRWRETISMNVGTGTGYNTRVQLRELALEACNIYWPDRTTTGTPKYYADYDYSHILISGTPDAAYPAEWIYWQLLPLLDDTNTTNWLTQYAPNALLHGSLEELFKFLKNNTEAEKWGRAYDRDMAALVGEDTQKIIDRYYKRVTS